MSITLINSKKQARAKLIHDSRAILDSAKDGKLNAEERAKWDLYQGQIDAIGDEVKVLERQLQLEQDLTAPAGRVTDDPAPGKGKRKRHRHATRGYNQMFRYWVRKGTQQVLQQPEHARNLVAETDLQAGYLTPPIQWLASFKNFVDDITWMLQKATVITITQATGIGALALETDADDATWTTELKTGSEDTGLAYGKRELSPYPLAKRIKLSNKLIDLVPAIEGIVKERFGYKFSTTKENAFMTGDGNKKPLGLFTADDNGIPTSRDMVCGTTTAPTADKMIDVRYSLKPQYQMGAEWVFHRLFVRDLRKLKDGNGQYLWVPGLSATNPDRFLELPVNQSEFAPSTFTTGQYVGLLGNLKNYWVVQTGNTRVQRLDQLYAETNQTGYIMREECDAQPVIPDSFTRLKLA
jgi:HK97 family phage major capsid protein